MFKQLSESDTGQRSAADSETSAISAQCTPGTPPPPLAPTESLKNTDSLIFLESIFSEVEALVSASFVFVQGMLAGVGLVLLLIGFGNSTTQTLAAISSVSVQLERAIFFLALVSAAGSINKLCVDNACQFHGSRSLVYHDVLAVCLHVTCVIFTILAAPVDEIMFHSSLRVPDWYALLINTNYDVCREQRLQVSRPSSPRIPGCLRQLEEVVAIAGPCLVALSEKTTQI